MMVTTFNGNPWRMNSSTNASDEIYLNNFFYVLSSLLRSSPKHNVLIIGHMNDQMIKTKTRKFSLHDFQTEMGNT